REHGSAIALCRNHSELGAVGGVHDRVLADGDGLERAQLAAGAEGRLASERAGDENQRREEERRDDQPPPDTVPAQLRPLPATATSGHAKTPSARSRVCARRRRSPSSRSAAAASGAAARTVIVARSSSAVTTTPASCSDETSSRSASIAAARSHASGSCMVISAKVSRLRIVELTRVSDASLSLGTTSREPSDARMNV